ncbi:MAG: aldehyde dehydrogenase family protein, partial [Defluviitaleaceae bacterium]|nr:aldehyde dehydrogenase family protein [Defluviitaleaceae bacterium]
MKELEFLADGKWHRSQTKKFMDVFNPSTGEVIARAPCCTPDEIAVAVSSARKAFAPWADTPVIKRVQVLYKLRELLIENERRLAVLVATENGKSLADAEGDVLKAREATEVALNAPSLLMGQSMRDASAGVDTV